jgi:hypothetical protein
MPKTLTISRPDVVALVEEAAAKLTCGNKTEAIALALRRLLYASARSGSLFGAHPNSVKVQKGTDLIAPAIDATPNAESGAEIER